MTLLHRLRWWLDGRPTPGERYDAYVALLTRYPSSPPRVTQPGKRTRYTTIWPELVQAYVLYRLARHGQIVSEAGIARSTPKLKRARTTPKVLPANVTPITRMRG